MATRRRKRRTHRKAAHCKNVRVNGKTRKMCWSAKGKLVSNKPAHRRAKRRRARR